MAKRAAAGLVAVALLAAACGDDEPDATTGDGRQEERELELRPEPSTTTTAAPGDIALDQLLIGEAPEGFERADDAMGAGALDLEAAAQAEADVDAERTLLVTRGFERGRTRAWLNPDDDVVYAAVYEFGTAADAALYLDDVTASLTARAATGFEVPEVAGARGFTTVDENDAGAFTGHAVTFVRDRYWFLLLAGTPGSGVTADTARQLAAAQAARSVPDA